MAPECPCFDKLFSGEQVSQVISQDSKGNTAISTKRYAPDFLRAAASTTSNAVLDNMITRNMLTSPIESIDTLKRTTVPLNMVVNAICGDRLRLAFVRSFY